MGASAMRNQWSFIEERCTKGGDSWKSYSRMEAALSEASVKDSRKSEMPFLILLNCSLSQGTVEHFDSGPCSSLYL